MGCFDLAGGAESMHHPAAGRCYTLCYRVHPVLHPVLHPVATVCTVFRPPYRGAVCTPSGRLSVGACVLVVGGGGAWAGNIQT